MGIIVQTKKQRQMKRQYIFLLAMLLLATISCDELPDELFEKQVLFARNGLIERELELTEANSIETNVSISVSGTSVLKQDVNFTITEFADTLVDLNKQLFYDNEEQYYTLLPQAAYNFNSYNGTVKKGDEFGTLPFSIDWKKLDMHKRYVLPIKIESTSAFQVAPNNASSMLIEFRFFNNYSGSYSLNSIVNGKSIQQSGIKINALDANSCFITLPLFPGEDYTFIAKVNSDKSLTITAKNPEKLTLEMTNNGELLDNPNVYIETEGMKQFDIAFKYKRPTDDDFINFEGAFASAVDEEE
ncbi:DUF4973 domain-containing protein [Prolixibacteraceae bacterium JC049]|nr:DUF4973 domain-containing protein [Prolixibacteraceae bacterium JC049]